MIPQQQPRIDPEEARHYAWVARAIEQYLYKYEPEVTGDLRKLTEARLRICIIEHCPAPSQMTQREIDLAERLEKAEADNAVLRAEVEKLKHGTVAQFQNALIQELKADNAALRSKRDAAMILASDESGRNAALRAALKFYSDPQSYGINGGTVNHILFDVGKRARAALGKEESK